jgi:hypothetical protein
VELEDLQSVNDLSQIGHSGIALILQTGCKKGQANPRKHFLVSGTQKVPVTDLVGVHYHKLIYFSIVYYDELTCKLRVVGKVAVNLDTLLHIDISPLVSDRTSEMINFACQNSQWTRIYRLNQAQLVHNQLHLQRLDQHKPVASPAFDARSKLTAPPIHCHR